MPNEMMGMSKETAVSNGRGGHLYMQTNEVKNFIVHYHRSANGTLDEVERVATGGAGSGTYKPISGQESARMPSREPVASSLRQIVNFCLRLTEGTIRFPVSPSASMAG